MAVAPLTKPCHKSVITEEGFPNLLESGCKYELVDGELDEVPTSFLHDVIIGNIAARMFAIGNGRGYFAPGQGGFRMVAPNTIRCPDFAFKRKEGLPGGVPPNTLGDEAPDLCVEVISSSERGSQMERKVREYFASGAKLVWHTFPETRRIVVFTSPDEQRTDEADDEIDAGDLLPGVRVRVGDLFELE